MAPVNNQRRVRAALAALLVIGVIVNAAALILFARSLDGIRGDFCMWTQIHHQAALELPQIPARQQAEASDAELLRQLGCK
jgi:hypothetical protein